MPEIERELGALRERADADHEQIADLRRWRESAERRFDRVEDKVDDAAATAATAAATAAALKAAEDERAIRWKVWRVVGASAVAAGLWIIHNVVQPNYHLAMDWLASLNRP